MEHINVSEEQVDFGMAFFPTEVLLKYYSKDGLFLAFQDAMDMNSFQLLICFVGLLFLLAVYHKFVARDKPGAWFEIHAFANGLTVLFATPSVILWLMDPIKVVSWERMPPPDILGPEWHLPSNLFHANNHWAVLVVLAVHTYHCIAFPLSKQDIFHHFVFVPVIGVYGGYFVHWGPVRNVLCFFISGLPGGIDYVILTMTKRNLVSKLFQKRIASKINLWCRGPAVGVLIPATCYVAWLDGEVKGLGMLFKTMLIAVFSAYNGIYYMEMAIKNYQMHLTKAQMKSQYMKEMAAISDKLEERETELYKDYWVEKATATTRQPAKLNVKEIMGTLQADASDSGKAFR